MADSRTTATDRDRVARKPLSAAERRRVAGMGAVIAALHALGWGIFVLAILPAHYKLLGLGVAVTAYTLGLRHAFDADHISAIDNTTRKLMSEDKRPLSVGFFFSLGHSSIVVALGVALTVVTRNVFHAVRDPHSALQSFGGVFGTAISGSFLYLIAAINVVILVGIARIFFQMRRGVYAEDELENQLQARGFMFRILGKHLGVITSPWQMYPVGVLFGLGFDTATEDALLAATAGAAESALPWYAVMALPVLFTAGMTLLDTIDGSFMNFAYGWAFAQPVRKVYYNLAITGLSIVVAFVVGTIEILGLVSNELHLGGFWGSFAGFNINLAGFVIAGLFVVVWAGALAIWRFGHIEQRWESAAAAQRAVRGELVLTQAFPEPEPGVLDA